MLGESGAGKTLILEIIAGLIEPDTGTLMMGAKNITGIPVSQREISLVFQDRTLFPHFTVKDNLAFPLKCRKHSRQTIKEEVKALARETGIYHLLTRMPDKLSAGESQRVALARSLAADPKILLLDEPLGSLDSGARTEMRSLLRKLNRRGQTIIQVTHDYEEALALADKIAVIENGRLTVSGRPEDVFANPQSEFVARFIGIKNFFRGRLERKSADLALFFYADLVFEVATTAPSGTGDLIIDSKNIIIGKSPLNSSARNQFEGTIKDIEPSETGMELRVDIGVPISVMITGESEHDLDLRVADRVWVSFKANSAKYIER